MDAQAKRLGLETVGAHDSCVHVRDLDCAFKLYRAEFLQRHHFETRSAMINAEMLYKFTHAGYTFKEVGVHHLPRKGGQATGRILKSYCMPSVNCSSMPTNGIVGRFGSYEPIDFLALSYLQATRSVENGR